MGLYSRALLEPLPSFCPNSPAAHISDFCREWCGLCVITGSTVQGTEVLPPWKGEWEGPYFPALTSLCRKSN